MPDCKSHYYKQQTLSSTTNMSTQAYQNVTLTFATICQYGTRHSQNDVDKQQKANIAYVLNLQTGNTSAILDSGLLDV